MSYSINNINRYWEEINKLLWNSATRDDEQDHIVKNSIKRNVDSILRDIKIQRSSIESFKIPSQRILKALLCLNENDSNFNAFYLAFSHINRALKHFEEAPMRYNVTFCLNKTLWKKEGTKHHPQLSLNFAAHRAPYEVWEKLVEHLVTGRPKAARAFEEYSKTPEFLALLEVYRSLPPQNPQEQDLLNELFDEINAEFFQKKLQKPRIVWAQRHAYRQLGRYNFSHDYISLSPVLKHPKTPRAALKFVLFHEMLHIVHGIKKQNGRAHTHTPQFKRDEARFPNHREIENILSRLSEIHSEP
ncbi:MAG: SprT-like domain-containing protein [Bradymonadales bacterium]|jgi:hypothetical protein